MIFKKIDKKDHEISTLKELIAKSKSESQKALMKKDLISLENGYLAEKENAYYLDFHFEEKERLILLHDIRIEHKGRTAQFDHIVIAPLGITILESKSFKGELTIDGDNSMKVQYGKYTKTFPNPVEQNIRHEKVLYDFIHDTFEIPTRFKLMGGIPINNKVLIHPNTTVSNIKLPEGFERSDAFASSRNKEIDNMGAGKVLLSTVTFITKNFTKEFAKGLIKAHKPIKFDYTMKYKVSQKDKSEKANMIKDIIEKEEPTKSENIKELICPRCKEGKLVKRKGKSKKASDKYQSNEFLGCSRFPKCRYTEEIKS